jgi:hypothetical protein
LPRKTVEGKVVICRSSVAEVRKRPCHEWQANPSTLGASEALTGRNIDAQSALLVVSNLNRLEKSVWQHRLPAYICAMLPKEPLLVAADLYWLIVLTSQPAIGPLTVSVLLIMPCR